MDTWTKNVIRRAKKLPSLDAHRRHKLRIATKKLHYATEFFASIFQKKRAKAAHRMFENSLKELQDALGVLNDIEVHERLADKYIHSKYRDSGSPAKAFAMGMLEDHEQTEAKACMVDAVEAVTRLGDAPRYWH